LATELVRIDPQEVIHETVDGEVILIALQTGCYYSLDGTGAEVWSGLAAGRSSAEIANELEHRYSAEPGTIPSAVAELVGRLLEERLVLPASNGSAPAAAERGANGAAPLEAPFTAPMLHKFTDMQDFLLVDPIHDVGDAGWPHAPTG
jgi:hypothetical protein